MLVCRQQQKQDEIGALFSRNLRASRTENAWEYSNGPASNQNASAVGAKKISLVVSVVLYDISSTFVYSFRTSAIGEANSGEINDDSIDRWNVVLARAEF